MNIAQISENFCRSRAAKGYGPERIKLELCQKGVSKKIASDTVLSSGIDWLALLQTQYEK